MMNTNGKRTVNHNRKYQNPCLLFLSEAQITIDATVLRRMSTGTVISIFFGM
jgi:hypothetical protein